MTMMMMMMMIMIIIIIHLLLLLLLLNYYYYYYYNLYIYFLLSLWLWQSNSLLILIHHFNSNFDCNICCFSRMELLSKSFKWYSIFFSTLFLVPVHVRLCSETAHWNIPLYHFNGPIWDHLSASIINDLKQKNSVLFSCGEITFAKTIGRCQQGFFKKKKV